MNNVRAGKVYSTELILTVIERVKEHPEIWQYSHPLHRKRFVHQRFWRALSQELGVHDKVLQRRWKHIKDQFRKELLKAVQNDDEDSVMWQYYKPLNFFREQVLHRYKEREVAAAIDAEESDSGGEDKPVKSKAASKQMSVLEKVQVLKKKTDDSTKLDTILNRLTHTKSLLEKKLQEQDAKNEDQDYLFLMSVLPSMKKLSDVQKLQFRGKINSWLLDALTVREYVNACDPDDDDEYTPTVMEIIKCESD